MAQINSINPEQLIYTNGVLSLTVLGGIRLEGLDRMRVTLKVELPDSPRPPLRHNLDLYNDTQVEKLIRKTAEKLEVGTSVIEASMAELTEQLEKYRLEQIKKQQEQQYIRKQLSTEEIEQAKTFLCESNLLQKTNELIGKSGVIGEELNRLIMFVIFTSRKRENPLHVVSLGSSGTGKTHLQEKVGSLVPEEERIEITTLSENAFYYFGQRELKHRVVLIEDLDGAENVMYPMRELMSKRKISKTIAHKNNKGETKTIHLVVEGPVSVAGCTTRESIYEDNANRSFLLYLDESSIQDEKIMTYQRAVSAGKINKEEEIKAATLLQNCQHILEPIKVVNPYAEYLQIPSNVLKPRRSNKHYLDFIETVTFYYQYQRQPKVDEGTGEIYIETTIEDIQEANKLMKEILLRKSDEITGACRNYFEKLKNWLKQENKTTFTNTQARSALRENHSNQKRYMLQLQDVGLVQKSRGNKKKGYYYEVISMEEYENRKEKITNILDEILQNLPAEVQSSKEVHKVNEPLKTAPVKENSKKFTKTTKDIPGKKRSRPHIDVSLGYTLEAVQKIEAAAPGKYIEVTDVAKQTGRSRETEGRNLKSLAEQGKLERVWNLRQYRYKLLKAE
jgi:predicted transcriptional regulator